VKGAGPSADELVANSQDGSHLFLFSGCINSPPGADFGQLFCARLRQHLIG
jgi:hypothetical protein